MKLSIQKVSQGLNLPTHTIERWIRQGRLPIHRDGDDCLFNEKTLIRWATEHGLTFTPPQVTSAAERKETVSLVEAIKRGGINYDLNGKDRFALLTAAVARISGVSAAEREELSSRLIEREKLTSTGMGKGVAIPHPRSAYKLEARQPLIATCFLETPQDFEAIDDLPVFVLFVMVCATTQDHLQLLSRLAYCLRDDAFIHFLKGTPTKTRLLDQIASMEARLEP
jgi:PTS system nitrogen regulatory IIA component